MVSKKSNKKFKFEFRVVHKKKTLKALMAMYSISMIAMAVIMLAYPSIAYASDGAAVITNSFKTLIDIVTALISSIGTLVLMWGFFEWGTSLQSQDGVMQSSAFKRIGGGLVMVLAPQLVTAFVQK